MGTARGSNCEIFLIIDSRPVFAISAWHVLHCCNVDHRRWVVQQEGQLVPVSIPTGARSLLCTSFPVPHLQPYSVQISPRRFVPQVLSAFVELADPPFLLCSPSPVSIRTACRSSLPTLFPKSRQHSYSLQILPSYSVPQVPSAFVQLADPPFLLCSPSPVSIRTACRSSLPTLFPRLHSHSLQISPSHSLLQVPRTFL